MRSSKPQNDNLQRACTLFGVLAGALAVVVLLTRGSGGESDGRAPVAAGSGAVLSQLVTNRALSTAQAVRIKDKRHTTSTIQYYKLEMCFKCKRADVRRYKCKDTFGDMITRMYAASRGTLLYNRDEWNFIYLCAPFNYDKEFLWSERVGLDSGRFHREGMVAGQKINYVPGARALVYDKSMFCKRVKSFWGGAAQVDPFFPACFVFPGDEDEFLEFQDRNYISKGLTPAWVFKKPKSSHGRDVSIENGALTREDLRGATYIQRIVDPPLLANNRKFDIRLYVVVPSFDPFRVYVYSRGYVRRTYVDYDPDFNNLMAHITNTYYQVIWAHKTNASDAVIARMMGPRGSAEDPPEYTKWSMRALIAYASRTLGIPQPALWRDMRAAIAKTLASIALPLSCRPRVGNIHYPCGTAWQLFGVDILMDDKGVPWVIEANTQPGFTNRGTIMWQLHTELIADAMTMTGVMPNLDNYLNIEEMRTFLVQRGFPAAARMHVRDLEVIATMVKEYAYRGNFDIAFPDTRWDWEPMADKLVRSDKPLYDAFLIIITQPDYLNLLRPWEPDYWEDMKPVGGAAAPSQEAGGAQ